MENEIITQKQETLVIASEIEEKILLLEKQAKEIKEKQQVLKDLLLVEDEEKKEDKKEITQKITPEDYQIIKLLCYN